METGTALVLGLAAGGIAWLLLRQQPAAAAGASSPGGPGSGVGNLYTGNDLGPLAPVLSLPGLKQAYGPAAAINSEIVQPVVNAINQSAPVTKFNALIGGQPTTVQNADGTITRTAPSNWYSDNIGKPISHAGSAVVNYIGGLW